MKTMICEESTALGRAAATWCQEKTTTYRAQSIFLPAGKTPVALYKEWNNQRPAYLDKMDLLQIDDILTGPEKGVFKRFLEEHLPLESKRIQYIDNADRSADLAVLGLGLNGHVAFHEPEIDRSFFGGCVLLSDTTCDHLKIAHGTWGISYGVGAFIRAKAILMMVGGSSKRDILKRLLASDQGLPASALLKHPDITLIADREAWPTDSVASPSVTSPRREWKLGENGAF